MTDAEKWWADISNLMDTLSERMTQEEFDREWGVIEAENPGGPLLSEYIPMLAAFHGIRPLETRHFDTAKPIAKPDEAEPVNAGFINRRDWKVAIPSDFHIGDYRGHDCDGDTYFNPEPQTYKFALCF